MRYVDFRDSIEKELKRNPEGLTWPELKKRLKLPYESPCYEWLARMEKEIKLKRKKSSGRAYIWTVPRAKLKSK